MIRGLRGNDRLLHPCQKLLRLRQRQPQIRYIGKVVDPADLQHLDTPRPAVGPRFNQREPTSSTIPQPATTRPIILLRSPSPTFWTLHTQNAARRSGQRC